LLYARPVHLRAAIAMLGALPFAVACTSSALSLDDPAAVEITVDPTFLPQGDSELYDVTITFHVPPESAGGECADVCRLLIADFGEGVKLDQHRFVDDWQVVLRLQRFADAPKGAHPLLVRIANRFGTFEATGELIVL